MSLAIRLTADPVLSLAYGDISGTYALIGSLNHGARILWVQNLTDETLMFSLDGVHDHFPLAAGAFVLLDATANKTVPTGAFFAEGQPFYVKDLGTGPGVAGVYVSNFYGTTGYR